MATITISVDDDVEQKFRKHAAELYGQRKGYLGNAITDAMKKWLNEHQQEEIAKEAIKRLNKGYHMGKLLYKKREELYER